MLTKPAHVKKRIWEQHLNWMNVMREGSLNGKDVQEKAAHSGNNAKPESNNAGKDDPASQK